MVILKDISGQSSSSNYNHDEKYDVFLSFRGVDTRLSFTNHLHKALEDANLKTFLDNELIPTGHYLKPELETAIKSSRASVIVLSKNYAFSTWCLEELVLIVDQHTKFNQIVIPIFYHVEPTDVRKQQNSFGDAIAQHKQKMEAETDVEKKSVLAEKIEIWKEALTKVSNLTGLNVKGRLETEFIKEIVKVLSKRIRVSIRTTLPLLIGKDDDINFITSWLKDGSSHTVDILSIYGMAGIGKTSLAKYVYESCCREFDKSGIIEDISRKWGGQMNGLFDLRKQVHDLSIASNKVLMVLDDIDSLDQLDVLLGNKGFHRGSKIIITTRDMSLTERSVLLKTKVEYRHRKYLLRGLSDEASLKLLCHHAFNCDELKDGYEEVSEDILKYCAGHPLALKVLSRDLYNRDLSYWEDCIGQLQKGPQGLYSRVNNILRMSFLSLESENDKELFKHIACFFVGMKKDYTETILKACNINTRTGITHLIDRCLLNEVYYDNVLMMHSLIQEMGRNEVRLESPEKPWKRSRIWCHEESLEVLNEKEGTGKIKGLTLDMRMIKKEESHESSFELEANALSKMYNLTLLQLNYVQLNEPYDHFPNKLKWLCMHGFPLESLPSDLPMKNLVALDMSYSNITSFDMSSSNRQRSDLRQKSLTGSGLKGTRLLGSLKILDVSFCKQLRSVGGFFELPALERLMATKCKGLIEICESIEECFELVFIDLSYCKKLEKLPLGKLKKVETLLLDGCNFGESQIEMRDMDSLEMIKLNDNSINAQTSSSSIMIATPRNLNLLEVSFPRSLVKLSLAYNNLSSESFPRDFSSLSLLNELVLDSNPIVSMPNCVRTLPRLKTLSMINCTKLTSIELPPPTLTSLTAWGSSVWMHKVVFDPRMSPMGLLVDPDGLSSSSFEIEGMLKVQPMADVEEIVLRCLGWSDLDFTKSKNIIPHPIYGKRAVPQIKMYYEFGIFSTIYGGKMMPNWISERKDGPLISFTIPSSPKNLIGLNICCVMFNGDRRFELPLIKISNITKKCSWIYYNYINRGSEVRVNGEYLTYISHWMFTMNDMEPGDRVMMNTIDIVYQDPIRECRVSFVYDDGNIKEKDVLGYYKSWNHIIGGDLSPFQLTTGEYFLNNNCFFTRRAHSFDYKYPSMYARFKDQQVMFKAFSNKKSNKLDRAIEDVQNKRC